MKCFFSDQWATWVASIHMCHCNGHKRSNPRSLHHPNLHGLPQSVAHVFQPRMRSELCCSSEIERTVFTRAGAFSWLVWHFRPGHPSKGQAATPVASAVFSRGSGLHETQQQKQNKISTHTHTSPKTLPIKTKRTNIRQLNVASDQSRCPAVLRWPLYLLQWRPLNVLGLMHDQLHPPLIEHQPLVKHSEAYKTK